MMHMTYSKREWVPSCMGNSPPPPDTKWRIMKDGDNWYHIECKSGRDDQWQRGLSGTKEWLRLTDEEASRAYSK